MHYYYLGFIEKHENFNHIRIFAQGNGADRDELRSAAVKLNNMEGSQRQYRVIQAQNKSEAMQQLSNLAKVI